jgi:hypothetical protein
MVVLIVFCVGVVVFPHDGSAQIPRTLSYQGILSDTLGTPKPDGMYAITFRLYDAPSGGTLLWVETQSLQVKRGLFSAVLGSQTPFPSSLIFERQYWLGIQPASDPELAPRIALTSVGYSLNALRADTARVALNAGIFADSARISGTVPNNSITANNIAAGQVVKSINNIRDAVTLRAQGGATITSSGDTITINAGSGGGGTGVQSIQNTNNTIDIINPSGPTVTANLKVPLSLTAAATPPNAVFSATSTSGGDAIAGRNTIGTGVAGVSTNGVGVYASSQQNDGIQAFSGAANKSGVWGSNDAGGVGVAGSSSSGTGVYGTSNTGVGVYGYNVSGNNAGYLGGSVYGVEGITSSTTTNAAGVRGVAGAGAGQTIGVEGVSTASPQGTGVVGRGNARGGYFEALAPGGTAVFGAAGGSVVGVGVFGTSTNGHGVRGTTNAANMSGVYGENSSTGNFGYLGGGSYAVRGSSSSGIGVYGYNSSSGNYGYLGSTVYGVYGECNSSGYGVYGLNTGNGPAGYFGGNVTVTGTLTKGGGSFRIDHPLDPANKYLYHSFVESPDMMNIYNGNVTTDANGNATIVLPEWFEALNKDFRYQLTVIDGSDRFVHAKVVSEIENNRFTIRTNYGSVKVSWQVTGIRHDPFAETHRMQVEVEKTGRERGKYIHPKEYGVSETLGIEYEAYQKMEAERAKMKAEHERMQAEHEKMNLERQKMQPQPWGK